MEVAKRADMNFEEARATCDTIRRGMEEVRELVLDLHDRRGWSALGYESWRDCVTTEFGQSKSHLYRQLEAARIEREICQSPTGEKSSESPMGEKLGTIPERQLRPLSAIPEGQRGEVWQEAKATAPGGKVTADHVQATVDRKLGKPETPRSQFKVEVNGQRSADPPDVAALRAAGKIGADVEVEITEPEPLDAAEQTTEPERSQSEDEWLAALPLSQSLSGIPLLIFRSDARRYFRLSKGRTSFRHQHDQAGSGLRKDGCYYKRLVDFLTVADPRDWIRCTTTENGGCNGTGQLTEKSDGLCPMCYGRGYTIDNRRDWRKTT